MPSIVGVQSYVAKAIKEERQCMEELISMVVVASGVRDRTEIPHLAEKILKLRNISRDVGWMRRLLADLQHEEDK